MSPFELGKSGEQLFDERLAQAILFARVVKSNGADVLGKVCKNKGHNRLL